VEQIDSGQIHLWLAYLDETVDAHTLSEYRLLLSKEEQQKQIRFHFERDRHRYLVTRAMQRTILSKYVDIAPSAWRFAVNDYGRPSIAAEHAAASGVEFNLSHTDGLVVMGVTRDRLIGIDVENIRARDVDIEIADAYFAPAEVLALRTLPGEKQKERFFQYWTLKESYIKARGMGLSIPLERFAFSLEDPKQIRLSIDPGLQDHAGRWRFWQLRVDQDHLTALCAEGRGGERPYLASVRSWPSRRS
jgi:4'-phosphopantetheinyl transferase